MKRFHRSDRVSEEIMKEVSAIIRNDMKDPRLGFVSVTRVALSRDLKHATVFFSVFGSEDEKEKTHRALTSGAGFVRSLLAKRLQLRYTPEVIFRLDNSIERGIRISSILKGVLPAEEPKEDGQDDDKDENL